MLKARLLTAFSLIAGFLIAVFLLPPDLNAGLFALVTALAAWEWAGLLQASSAQRIAFGAVVLLSCALVALGGDVVAPVLWVLAVAFWLLAPLLLRTNWRPGLLGYPLGWLLLVPTWAALADLIQRSPLLLLGVMSVVWVADSAAYFTGRAFGKRKLAPRISPGKTWEGAAGGLLGVMLCGLLANMAYPQVQPANLPWLASFLVLLTAFSIIGDLFESMLKRQAKLKDSSQLLPGHGGILDRVDSQLSVLPLVALTLYWTGT